MINNLKYAVMFPGQGSQYVGMAQDLYENSEKAKDLFLQAELTTNMPLRDLMFKGPDEILKQTNNTQPCLQIANIALYQAFLEKVNNHLPSYVCGHSAGEYSALYAAGVLSFGDSLDLIMHRGKLMSEVDAGSMLAILNASEEQIKLICETAITPEGVLNPANWNSEGQTVISGDLVSIYNAMDLSFEMGITAIPLPVSGAFHSKLMSSVTQKYSKYLKEVIFNKPSIPIIANTTGKPIGCEETWKSTVVDQIVSPVKWKQTIRYLHTQGINTFIEIGPNNVLSKLVTKDYSDVQVFSINDIDSLEMMSTLVNN